MKKPLGLILLLLFCSITLLYHGCSTDTNESLYWMEGQGQFCTNDLARAQAEIPFTILLPTYIPDKRQEAPLPQIEGALRSSGDDNEVEVIVRYPLYLSSEITGHVFITERNSTLLPPDPEVNPDYEYLEIRGKRLVKTEGNFPLGPGTVFYFSHDNIYFVVETYNLSAEEALKVVESMIEQL